MKKYPIFINYNSTSLTSKMRPIKQEKWGHLHSTLFTKAITDIYHNTMFDEIVILVPTVFIVIGFCSVLGFFCDKLFKYYGNAEVQLVDFTSPPFDTINPV